VHPIARKMTVVASSREITSKTTTCSIMILFWVEKCTFDIKRKSIFVFMSTHSHFSLFYLCIF